MLLLFFWRGGWCTILVRVCNGRYDWAVGGGGAAVSGEEAYLVKAGDPGGCMPDQLDLRASHHLGDELLDTREHDFAASLL